MYATATYVIHYHAAHQAGDHWDIRIEAPNSNYLKSFAVPKMKIPQKLGEKALLINTENHGKFWLNVDDMDITEGYGKGKIRRLELGTMELLGWGPTFITFQVRSSKYFLENQKYALIKFKGTKKTDKKDNLWILLLVNPNKK